MILPTDSFLKKNTNMKPVFWNDMTMTSDRSHYYSTSQTHSNIYRFFTFYQTNSCVHPPVAPLCKPSTINLWSKTAEGNLPCRQWTRLWSENYFQQNREILDVNLFQLTRGFVSQVLGIHFLQKHSLSRSNIPMSLAPAYSPRDQNF